MSQTSSRKAVTLHRQVIDLRGQKSTFSEFETVPLVRIKELFESRQDTKMFNSYLQYALNGSLSEPDDLLYILRSFLRIGKIDEILEVMKNNIDMIRASRNLLYEYIVISSRFGRYEQMYNAITYLDQTYGISGVNSKVLQALIKANTSEDVVEKYIEKINNRFNENSPYEIVKAAFNTNNWEIARRYIRKVKPSPRADLLVMRTLLRMGDIQATRKFFSNLTPSDFNETQILQIIRTGLQIDLINSMEPWFKHSQLTKEEVERELDNSQYNKAVSDSDFTLAMDCFKRLYRVQSFSSRQILVLIKSNKASPVSALHSIYEFGRNDPYLLSIIIPIAFRYREIDLATSAYETLRSIALCSIGDKDIHNCFFKAVRNSSNVQILQSTYSDLGSFSYDGECIFDFANYCDKLFGLIGHLTEEENSNESSLLEARILSVVVEKHRRVKPLKAKNNHVLIVNNSLKFGGAERQVVHCLSAPTFTKSLVVWNADKNTSTNSFIDEVSKLDVRILDYSKEHMPSSAVFTDELKQLLSLIPNIPTLNPDLTNKIKNLVGIILQEKPSVLHLWQDTTSVLGAISGLIAGVPRIVMSARSLPPFADEDSTFPNKGENYYFNNSFVRALYKKVLQFENVFLCHNSENGLEKYTEWLGGYEDKMMLLRNGFKFNEFEHKSESMKKSKIVIGSVFRFVDVKRPLLWLDCAKLIANGLNQEVEFCIIGDGPLLQSAINHSKEIGIDQKVNFMGYRDDVSTLLPHFDAFMLTSSIEGLPNVLIEAQASGVPVLSTNVGGAKETFIDSASGITVDSDEPEDIASAMIRMLSNSKIMIDGKLAGRKFVESRFAIEVMHKQLRKILFEDFE
tara:strand:+ start:3877 stop:6438 length:2562 start_codon:yes stop_codon:yes gene_type:complete